MFDTFDRMKQHTTLNVPLRIEGRLSSNSTIVDSTPHISFLAKIRTHLSFVLLTIWLCPCFTKFWKLLISPSVIGCWCWKNLSLVQTPPNCRIATSAFKSMPISQVRQIPTLTPSGQHFSQCRVTDDICRTTAIMYAHIFAAEPTLLIKALFAKTMV